MRSVLALAAATFTVLVAAGGVAVGGLAAPASAEAGAHRTWVWPLSPRPEVVRTFQPPRSRWGPGHRGVDLAGTVGQQVLAIGAGTVTFAAVLAGRGVVVVRHGALRSTYEPVTALVHRGQQVGAGEPIGLLQKVASHCLPRTCLHLGVRRGDAYIDPLPLLPAGPIRLKPLHGLHTQGATGSLSGSPPRGAASGPTGHLPGRHPMPAGAGELSPGSSVAREQPAGPAQGGQLAWGAGTVAGLVGAGVGGVGLAGAALRRRQARG